MLKYQVGHPIDVPFIKIQLKQSTVISRLRGHRKSASRIRVAHPSPRHVDSTGCGFEMAFKGESDFLPTTRRMIVVRYLPAACWQVGWRRFTTRTFASNRTTVQTLAQRRFQTRFVLALVSGATAGVSVYFFLPDKSRSAITSSSLPLSPSHFTPATIENSQPSGPNTKLLDVVVPPHLIPVHDPWEGPFAPIWSVYIKDDDIQVERPYTPLQGIDEQGRMRFWIKSYLHGEVGRWLHGKAVGERIELRGSLKTWSWQDGEWDQIVMV